MLACVDRNWREYQSTLNDLDPWGLEDGEMVGDGQS